MKAILLIVIIGSAFASNSFLSKHPTLNGKDAEQFALGFALGVGVLNDIPDVASCALDATHVKGDVTSAIQLISNGDLESIVEGIQELTGVLDAIANSCGNTVVESVAYFGQLKSIVWNKGFPEAAAQNLFKNIKVVVGDVTSIIKSEDWIMKGAYAGDLAKIAIFGEPNDK